MTVKDMVSSMYDRIVGGTEGIYYFTGTSGNISDTISNYQDLVADNFRVMCTGLSSSSSSNATQSGTTYKSSTITVSYNAGTGAWSVTGTSNSHSASYGASHNAAVTVYGVVVNINSVFS